MKLKTICFNIIIIGLIILFIGVQNSNTQTKICTSDSMNCTYKNSFRISDIKIDKKFNCSELVYIVDVSILMDIDNDCIPELIISAFLENKLLIINSLTGLVKKEIKTPFRIFSPTSIAMADVDGDHIPEIFTKSSKNINDPSNSGKIICYNIDGSIKWTSNESYLLNSNYDIGGRISLSDFNQDGIPELFIKNIVFNALTGVKLIDGGLNGLGSEFNPNFTPEAMSVAAQLDEDSTDLELAAGFSIYKVKIVNKNSTIGNEMIPNNITVDSLLRDGNTSIGDVNSDGILDVVVSSSGISNKGILYSYGFKNSKLELIAKAYPPSNYLYISRSNILNQLWFHPTHQSSETHLRIITYNPTASHLGIGDLHSEACLESIRLQSTTDQ
jgi:hypothetical protein